MNINVVPHLVFQTVSCILSFPPPHQNLFKQKDEKKDLTPT